MPFITIVGDSPTPEPEVTPDPDGCATFDGFSDDEVGAERPSEVEAS